MAVDLWDSGVKVAIVYPGLVDTELFSLPDNDPVLAAVESVPVSKLVEAVFDGLDQGLMQIYVPAYFADLASQKASDVPAFLAGMAAFVAAQRKDA
jgi:short-subunit dehydrogenase